MRFNYVTSYYKLHKLFYLRDYKMVLFEIKCILNNLILTPNDAFPFGLMTRFKLLTACVVIEHEASCIPARIIKKRNASANYGVISNVFIP